MKSELDSPPKYKITVFDLHLSFEIIKLAFINLSLYALFYLLFLVNGAGIFSLDALLAKWFISKDWGKKILATDVDYGIRMCS